MVGAYCDIVVYVTIIQMAFTLMEVEALVNFYQIEICLWRRLSWNWQRTPMLERIAEKLGNKYCRGNWDVTQICDTLLFTGQNP